MDVKKVLYISQEITPYLPETPLSSFGRLLPQGIQEKNVEVRTFMPRYGCINERRNQLHEVIRLSGMNIIIDDTDHQLIIKVATLLPTRMQVYFIDNDDYFERHSSGELETSTSPADNDERSMFFVHGVIETVKKLRWEPSIVHCTGWLSALTPLYLKHIYGDDPSFRGTKVVYSLFGGGFDGTLDSRLVDKLKQEGLTDAELASLIAAGSQIDALAINKLAIDHADGVIASSPDVDQRLIDYAVASGKPFMPYPGEDDYVSAYHKFYTDL